MIGFETLVRCRASLLTERGATLLEVLVVLAIIALLASVVGPRFVGYLSKAKSQTAAFQLDNLKAANEFFFVLGRAVLRTRVAS